MTTPADVVAGRSTDDVLDQLARRVVVGVNVRGATPVPTECFELATLAMALVGVLIEVVRRQQAQIAALEAEVP